MILPIKNLLGSNMLKYVQDQIHAEGLNWYYLPYTATESEPRNDYSGSFGHLIYQHQQGAISSLFEVTNQILLNALDAQGQRLEKLFRIRLGMITRAPYNKVHSPHIDSDGPHRTGIFYPYDSSGDTIVYNEQTVTNAYTEQFRQSPTENLWFDFDGRTFHSSSTPTDHETRLVLTFNYLIYE
jgi:hypothetical protein